MRPARCAVVTVSDKGSRGERVDESGNLISQILIKAGHECMVRRVVPDVTKDIERALNELCIGQSVDVIITTGGTGFTTRDVTPEATQNVIERVVPGIPEALRQHGMTKTPYAMLSRGVAGIRDKTLIVNLPGSVRAVQEGLEVIVPVLKHVVEVLESTEGVECGQEKPPPQDTGVA